MKDSILKQTIENLSRSVAAKTQVDNDSADSVDSTYSASKIEELIANIPTGGEFSGTLDDIDEGTANKHFTSTEKTKLSGIENNATKYPDTGEEVYSSAEKSKLAGIEANATKYPDTGEQVFTDALKTKLDGIETGATKYPDTGEEVYSSAEKTKLAGIAAGAEVNVNADWNSSSGDSQILNKPTVLALGETSGTAYRGDRGKTAYDHSQTTHAPSDAINKTTADGYYEAKFVTELIGSGANYDIIGNTNIIIYHTGDENAEVNFAVDTGLPSGTFVRVKVVNIPNGFTVTLDFSDKLNWNPQTSSGVSNPVLTDADNGYSGLFMLTDLGGGEIWWQQLQSL